MAHERKVSATEARVHFGELLRDVATREERVIVERGGKPQAVLMSMADYQKLVAAQTPLDWEDALDNLHRFGRRLVERRPMADPADVIRETRDERDADFHLP